MNYEETCNTIVEVYKGANIEALKEARDKAYETYQTANTNYLDARAAYHQIYHKLWVEIQPTK